MDIFGSLRFRILDIVRLIDDEHREGHLSVYTVDDLCKALVIGHRGSALPDPAAEGILQQRAVDQMRFDIAEFLDLPAPVDKDRGRAHDKEPALGVLRIEMCHRRDRLDRLSQSHLIAQQYTSKGQNIARPERLIRAQVSLESAGIERESVDLLRQLSGNTAVDQFALRPSTRQLFDQCIISSAVLLKVLQRCFNTHMLRFLIPGDQVSDTREQRALSELDEVSDRQDRRFFGLSSGENPLQAIADRDAADPLLNELMKFSGDRFGLRGDLCAAPVDGDLTDQRPAFAVTLFRGQADMTVHRKAL